jgi:ribosomal protein S18 acetylase RimI-like enzyme
MAAGYSLRDATERDFEFLYSLHEQTMKSYVDQTWGWVDADQRARFRAGFDPTKQKVIVSDGQDVGVVAVEESPLGMFIRFLEIAPPWQGRGMGAQVIEDIIKAANMRGLTTRLQVLKVNPARRLYERLGFKRVEETQTHHIMEIQAEGAKR